MTYSNFARRKGSKNKKGKKGSVAGTAAKALGGAALLAGGYNLAKRGALGELGKTVAARARNVVQTAAAQGAYGVRVARTKAGKVAKDVGQKVAVTWRKAKRKGYEAMGNAPSKVRPGSR